MEKTEFTPDRDGQFGIVSSFGRQSVSIIFRLSSHPFRDLISSTMSTTSISITFENLLGIALGKAEDVTNVRNKDIPEIIQYLKKEITWQILENVNAGLDPGNSGNVRHRRSRNHTVKLLKLDGGLQVRLDMQSNEETKAGVVGEGIYMCKLTTYQAWCV